MTKEQPFDNKINVKEMNDLKTMIASFMAIIEASNKTPQDKLESRDNKFANLNSRCKELRDKLETNDKELKGQETCTKTLQNKTENSHK
jgi:hypothetical protein